MHRGAYRASGPPLERVCVLHIANAATASATVHQHLIPTCMHLQPSQPACTACNPPTCDPLSMHLQPSQPPCPACAHAGPFMNLPCNAFAFCPDDVCFEPDAHHHTKGDCWLKFTEAPLAPEVRPMLTALLMNAVHDCYIPVYRYTTMIPRDCYAFMQV